MPHTASFEWAAGDAKPTTVFAGDGVYGTITGADGMTRPLRYSRRKGIQRDDLHVGKYGPKGHVPEEFVDCGTLTRGDVVALDVGVACPADADVVMIVGANAAKSARVNDDSFAADDAAYCWMRPVRARRGANPIRLTLVAERDGPVRAWWAFTRPENAEQMRRPERVVPASSPVTGSRVTYRGTFTNVERLERGRLQVAGVATVRLDGNVLGRQGGFDPYKLTARVNAYDLPPLSAGTHEVRVELIDPGVVAPLLADLRAFAPDGRPWTWHSDATWLASRDVAPAAPVQLWSGQDGDPAAFHLNRRPHPLPAAAWLEGPQPPVVLDWPPMLPAEPIDQSFRWRVPPGARSMRLALREVTEATLQVDGLAVAIGADGEVDLETDSPPCRIAVLSVRSRESGGGVFDEPVTYTFGDGTLLLGSWVEQGLRSYSGSVRMMQAFELEEGPLDAAVLDLGLVRGTVGVTLNGLPVGERFLPPYKFDILPALRPGRNELELLCTNTLANFLSTRSPTRSWSPDQLHAGIMGPVTLHLGPSAKVE